MTGARRPRWMGPRCEDTRSSHTGMPVDVPIDAPISIRAGPYLCLADIGTNATILPGVTVGPGRDCRSWRSRDARCQPFAIVAGVPARFLRWREGVADPSSQSTEDQA